MEKSTRKNASAVLLAALGLAIAALLATAMAPAAAQADEVSSSRIAQEAVKAPEAMADTLQDAAAADAAAPLAFKMDRSFTALRYAAAADARSATATGKWGNLSWTLSDGVLTITGSGAMPDRTSEVTPSYSAYGSSIEKVVVGEGVTSVGNAAFYEMYNLQSAQLPSTLTSIGSGAFADCYSLSTVNLPDRLKSIDSYAFQGTRLQSVTLPAKLTSLDSMAFYDASSLTAINVAAGNAAYKSNGGVLYSKDGKTLMLCPAGKTGQYAVPSGVVTIGENAFMYSSLQTITLPNTVKTISDGAFCYSRITSLALPNSVTSVGDYICEDCTALTTVSVGTGLKSLSYRMFSGCTSLVNVNLGKVTDLDMLAFSYCSSLKKIVIPSGVKAIMNGTFGECTALQSVIIPSTVKEIAYQAFLNCHSLTSISLPEGLEKIYRYSFALCTGLKTVRIPSTVTHIGEEAFPPTTKMTNIPAGLTKLEDGSYSLLAKVAMKGKQYYSEAFSVLTLVNAERKKRGLSALAMDKNLLEVAMQRAMETTLYWSHTRPTGSDCFTASSLMAAENIAVGQSSAKGVMNSWMNSSGHRGNILDEDHTTIGIGCVEVNQVKYWVQCFGTNKATTASKSSYKNGSKTRKVLVSPEKPYYRPTIKFATRLAKKGATAKVTCTWYNDFTTVTVPATSLVYKSSKASVVSASKGVLKAKKNTGSATVSVYFPGYVKGAVSKEVTITTMNTPALKSVKNAKGKKMAVTWKKVAGAAGYQISYATKSTFKGAKNVLVKKGATVKRTVSKLSKGKTYYVKVRAYKTVGGKKQYSAWSTVKKVKIAK